MDKCITQDCDRLASTRGYCRFCYQKMLKQGTIQKLTRSKKCNTPECEELVFRADYCKSCKHKHDYNDNREFRSAQIKEYNKANKEKMSLYAKEYRKENNDARTEYNRSWRRDNAPRYLWNKARLRAKEIGLEFNIEISDVIIPKYCPIFGTEMEFAEVEENNGPRSYPNSPSIDRIDNSKGYIKGNIIVISCRANVLKSDGTPEEFAKLSNFLKGRALPEEDCHYW